MNADMAALNGLRESVKASRHTSQETTQGVGDNRTFNKSKREPNENDGMMVEALLEVISSMMDILDKKDRYSNVVAVNKKSIIEKDLLDLTEAINSLTDAVTYGEA